MQYGSLEFSYAEPFANALVADPAFREWVLRHTKFSEEASGAKLLSEEMKALRSKSSATWWRSHYSEKCRCEGCSGQETDILAVFEAKGGHRFAVHFEVKQPTDRFPAHKDQGKGYAVRAQCWVNSAPKAILPHSDADTVLVCSASKLREYASHLPGFGSVITFEDVAERFPEATAVVPVLAPGPALGLREMVNASIERGGQNTDEDIERALDATAAELAKEGF